MNAVFILPILHEPCFQAFSTVLFLMLQVI